MIIVITTILTIIRVFAQRPQATERRVGVPPDLAGIGARRRGASVQPGAHGGKCECQETRSGYKFRYSWFGFSGFTKSESWLLRLNFLTEIFQQFRVFLQSARPCPFQGIRSRHERHSAAFSVFVNSRIPIFTF